MYRASRQLNLNAARSAVRVSRRNLATETPSAPKKKPRIIRRIFWATATLTGSFYVGSAFLSFKSQTYYDFFNDRVPLGQAMLEYAEAHHWDTLTLQKAIDGTTKAARDAQRFVMEKVNGAPSVETVKASAHEAKAATLKTIESSKERVKDVASRLKTEVEKDETKVEAAVKHQTDQLVKGVSELVKEAESALGVSDSAAPSKPVPDNTDPSAASAPPVPEPPSQPQVYEGLPVEFQPPPGYKSPSPPKVPEPPKPIPEIPLVAPSVSALASSEPIIAHLANTIDNLTYYLKSNPDAAPRVTPVLETAKSDLTALAERIEKAREEERFSLEAKMDEQTREYTLKLLEVEMEAQDRLDNQEDEFRKLFDMRQSQLIQQYRGKLEEELKTQTDLINERLKNEVINQGIELQRRWIREIKMRVEEERGGRLAKIDELSAQLKRIERVALDNSEYLDENIRIHALWSAIRTLSSSALGAPVRKPFREELRVVRHISAARDDPIVAAALETLETSEVPDVGVEPLADLTTWYTSSVQPKVSAVALVPDQDAGLLSHLASHLLSGFRFKRTGLVEGKDTLSVLARAEHYLNEKDLDSAARELNQLTGTAKTLLHDWLEAARRRLEVEQALEVVQTQATLASLLVV
ncbi:MICOS complex subunit mic60 [Stygiomarasmius scandens]|uniref:MICOS complex subunit MIC60 n=1 Tax=Marasmiellus scandens TaxID=2682957 RepID=A0ABR1JJN0_9AGAR